MFKRRKKIDWFLIFFFILAVIFLIAIILIINQIMVEKKAVDFKSDIVVETNLDVTENYLNFISQLKNSLDNLENVDSDPEVVLSELEEKMFSVRVPVKYQDLHLQLVLIMEKIKTELKNQGQFNADLQEIDNLIILNTSN